MSTDSKKLTMESQPGEVSPCLQDESVENSKKQPIFDKYLSKFSYTKRGRLTLLVLTVLCLVLLIVVIALAGAWPRWPKFIGNTCDKPSCLIASAQMLQSAELSAGVCQNPWIWACGGWQDNNIAKTIWSYKDELDYRETVRARVLIGSLPAGLPGSSEWILTELYNSCAATDNIEVENDLPLKKIIRDLDGWHVLRNWSLLRWELRSALSRIQSRYGARPYFDVTVRQGTCNQGSANYQSGNNGDKFDSDELAGCIVLNPPKLGLPHRELYYKPSDHSITLAYKRLMRDVTSMLGATSTDASQFSDDVYYYERRLAETAASLGDIDSDTKYKMVTLQQLQSAAPQLPVYDVLTSMFPRAKIKLSTHILIPSLKYARRLSELISTSDRGPINNYMMWTLTFTYLPYLSSAYRTAYRDFQQSLTSPGPSSSSTDHRRYLSTAEPAPPRWYECAKVVRDWAGPILENQDIPVETDTGVDLEKSEPSRSKERVRWIFAKVRDAVIDAVLRSQHVVGERQREAVKKLKTTTLQIGAPAESHVNAYRERFYRDFTVLRNAFFENALAAGEQSRAIMESALIAPPPGTQSSYDSAVSMLKFMAKRPLSVRFYEPQRTVTLPLSLLQQPHFHIDHPVSLQIARLGVPIAEALFSGVFNILADNDTDSFLQCFSNHITIGAGKKGTALKNAAIHLAAVRAAASALNKIQIQADYESDSTDQDNYDSNNDQMKNHDRPKKEFQHGLGEMNSRQLFTLAYAQTMCSKSTSEMEQLSPLIRRKLSDYDLFMLSWSRVKDLPKSMGCKLPNFDACPSTL